MVRRALFVALLSLFAVTASAKHGIGGVAPNAQNPLNGPLLAESAISTTFTHLGSFSVINGSSGFRSPGLPIFVKGTTMYMGGFDSSGDGRVGIGDFTLPTLSGTPAYDGSNGTVTAGMVINAPNRPASYTPWGNASGDSVTGVYDNSGTLIITGTAYFPGGCKSILGWAVTAPDTSPSSWGTVNTYGTPAAISSLTWSSGVVTATTASPIVGLAGSTHNVAIYGASPSGYNGTYNATVTGASTFTYPLASNPGTETVAGTYLDTCPSRQLSGTIGAVPTIWQPLLGGPLYEAGGISGAVVNVSMPMGHAVNFFDPSNLSSTGAAHSVTVAQNYPYVNGFASAYVSQENSRSFYGPFPLCVDKGTCPGTTFYPATLAAAPQQNNTNLSFVLPSATATFTGSVTKGSTTLTVSAVSGTVSNSAIFYSLQDTAGCVKGLVINPAWDQGPGVAIGPGTYNLRTAATCTATGDTITLTPQGYGYNAQDVGRYWMIILSDGERFVAHLQLNQAAIPYHGSGSSDPTTLMTLGTDGFLTTPSSVQNCTVGSPCTTAVQVAPLGDQIISTYPGAYGYGFFLPNTKTFVVIGVNNYGIDRGRFNEVCQPGGSGNDYAPLPPDSSTAVYERVRVFLYDETNFVNVIQQPSSHNPYDANPYGMGDFPGYTNMADSNGCIQGLVNSGWMYFDPDTSILYTSRVVSATVIVDEFQVSHP